MKQIIIMDSIKLDEECTACKLPQMQSSDKDRHCVICGGIGRVPTVTGEAILTFMKRYARSDNE